MYEYGIENFGLNQAQEYFLEIHGILNQLARNVNLGRCASEYAPSLKRFSHKSHTIFYFTSNEGVFIIRILGQRMDYHKNL